MSTAQINYLNILLMLVALAAAIYLPFEVFLFSYAVLGPLHYLTEISWLHDRNYFTARKFDWTVLAMLTLLVSAGSTLVLGERYAISALTAISTDLIFIAFGFALVAVITDDWGKRAFAMVGVVLLATWFHGAKFQHVVFMLFVPTIIHVFIFTGAFVLFGALKHKHWSGYVSTVIFVLCAAAAILVRREPGGYEVSEYIRSSYKTFIPINIALNDLFGFDPILSEKGFFRAPGNIAITQFIAWAYTYHYLNWFSKTSIIGWHKVPKVRMSIVAAIWLASLALYAKEYELGVKWLFLLSFAHVLLEFPLNHRSFIGIGQEMFGMLKPATPVLAAGAQSVSAERKKRARALKQKNS